MQILFFHELNKIIQTFFFLMETVEKFTSALLVNKQNNAQRVGKGQEFGKWEIRGRGGLQAS